MEDVGKGLGGKGEAGNHWGCLGGCRVIWIRSWVCDNVQGIKEAETLLRCPGGKMKGLLALGVGGGSRILRVEGNWGVVDVMDM